MKRQFQIWTALILFLVSVAAQAGGPLYVDLIQFNADLATTPSTADYITRQMAANQAFNEQRPGTLRWSSQGTIFTVNYADGGTESFYCGSATLSAPLEGLADTLQTPPEHTNY